MHKQDISDEDDAVSDTTIMLGDCDYFCQWLSEQHAFTQSDLLDAHPQPSRPESGTLENCGYLESSRFGPSDSYESLFIVPRRERPVLPMGDSHFLDYSVEQLDRGTDTFPFTLSRINQPSSSKCIPQHSYPSFVPCHLKTNSTPISSTTSPHTRLSPLQVHLNSSSIQPHYDHDEHHNAYLNSAAASTMLSSPASPLFSPYDLPHCTASRWSVASFRMGTSPAQLHTSAQVYKTKIRTSWLKKLDPRQYSFSSIKRKKLVVRGIAQDDHQAVYALIQWCEGFGEVRRILRDHDGALQIHFCKTSVADTARNHESFDALSTSTGHWRFFALLWRTSGTMQRPHFSLCDMLLSYPLEGRGSNFLSSSQVFT